MDWALSCITVILLWYFDFMSMSERRKREWNENLMPISRWRQILSSPDHRLSIHRNGTPKPIKICIQQSNVKIQWWEGCLDGNSKLLSMGAWLTTCTLALSAAIWLEFLRSITNWPLHKAVALPHSRNRPEKPNSARVLNFAISVTKHRDINNLNGSGEIRQQKRSWAKSVRLVEWLLIF